jgi:hypothetical protein
MFNFIKNKFVITLMATISLMFATATMAFASTTLPAVPSSGLGATYVESWQNSARTNAVIYEFTGTVYEYVDANNHAYVKGSNAYLWHYNSSTSTWTKNSSMSTYALIDATNIWDTTVVGSGYTVITDLTTYNSTVLGASTNNPTNSNGSTDTSVNGIDIGASTFQPLVDAIKQIIVVVLPIGMGIMGLFLVIELVPGLIRKFF